MNLEKIWTDLVLLGVGAMCLVLAITTADMIYAMLGCTAFIEALAEAVAALHPQLCTNLDRGTGKRKGSRGRFPEYSAKRGQANYEMNRR